MEWGDSGLIVLWGVIFNGQRRGYSLLDTFTVLFSGVATAAGISQTANQRASS